MPLETSKPALLSAVTGPDRDSLAASDRNPTAKPFTAQPYAPAWLAQRARVPLYLAELLAALACLGGGI